jgi:hypothetical protein
MRYKKSVEMKKDDPYYNKNAQTLAEPLMYNTSYK